MNSLGEYPNKSRTAVVDVARYQNDGTDRISPSRFIERAAEASDEWVSELQKGIAGYLNENPYALKAAAAAMARDVSIMCDRIKTRQLKRSFIGRVSHGRD